LDSGDADKDSDVLSEADDKDDEEEQMEEASENGDALNVYEQNNVLKKMKIKTA
jgi:hypothetical protein